MHKAGNCKSTIDRSQWPSMPSKIGCQSQSLVMSKPDSVDSGIPKVDLCVVARSVGRWSEVWLWRQLLGFKQLKPCVMTWEYVNREVYRLDNLPVQLLPFDPLAGEDSLLRWFRRAQSLPVRNFFASVGAERRFIEKQLLERKPRVMLCHYGHTALRVLPIAQKQHIPLVAHFHGLDLSSSLNNRWYRWSLLRALEHFSAIVVVGKHQEKWMIEHGARGERVHLIPCGVPTQDFKHKARQPSKGIQFICVCRLVEGKGVEYCIRAFAQVVKEITDGNLLIVGDGPLRSDLEALRHELGLGQCVTFAGSVFPDRVKDLLSESDVFIQHSLISSTGWVEGFGVSIAEAAATGLPIVATRCGGIVDQVMDGKTGFLVEQRDVDSMAKHMVKLGLDPDLRRKMGQSGRERMVAEFDIQKQIAKLESVLLDCSRE